MFLAKHRLWQMQDLQSLASLTHLQKRTAKHRGVNNTPRAMQSKDGLCHELMLNTTAPTVLICRNVLWDGPPWLIFEMTASDQG